MFREKGKKFGGRSAPLPRALKGPKYAGSKGLKGLSTNLTSFVHILNFVFIKGDKTDHTNETCLVDGVSIKYAGNKQ